MNRRDVPEFERAWKKMLRVHRLPALQMIELGPNGPHPHVVGEATKAMLTDAVKAANLCRIFSFSATWNNRSHEDLFSAFLRKRHLSVYALSFLMAVEINRASAVKNEYKHTIDYILDDGNPFKAHVNKFRRSLKDAETLASSFVGDVFFETDTKVSALQAADLIVWATRRKFSGTGKGLNGVYAPLEGLFDKFYVHSPAPPKLIAFMGKRFEVAETNIDPDSFVGRILVRRWEIYWTGVPVGLALATLSFLRFVNVFWIGLGVAVTTFVLHALGVWWMKRSFRSHFK